ncbi:MAG: MTH865 family protein [Actinobacteria bacterium]|nr:MTH865 family protein [Actinomycetota bacterium]
MNVKDELKRQIVGALAGATFPIAGPEELLAAFPQGADTTCAAGGITLRAGDAGGVLTPGDFPFQSAEQVAETILSRAL